jgi:hypothetical protein
VTDRITLPNVTDDEHRTLNGLLDQLEREQRRGTCCARRTTTASAQIRQVGSVIPPMYFRLGIVARLVGEGGRHPRPPLQPRPVRVA